jgi:hypothetical protein
MSDWYELIGQTPVRMEGDIISKAMRFEQMERRVASTKVLGLCLVSTVFLGLDHGWNPRGPAVLFETMAFWRGEGGYEQERCSTWQEAEAQHARMCTEVARPSAVMAYARRQAREWWDGARTDLGRRWRDACGVELTEMEKMYRCLEDRIFDREEWW